MVDVKVIDEQLKEVKLDKATEKRIRKLLGNSKTITIQQASIIQSIIDDAIRSLKLVMTPSQLLSFSSINVMTTSSAMEKLMVYDDNIAKMFRFGIKFTSPSGNSQTVKLLEEAVRQSCRSYITRMGNDLRTRAGQIVADGIGKSIPTNDIVAKLEKELNISRSRANSIARTETMRAAHNGSLAQARRDGMKYYIIDSRAEACKYCQRTYKGVMFDIDDTSHFPPLHPNCACVPLYFMDDTRANRWATKISNEIDNQVQQLTDKGLKVKPDGTGTEVNKIPAKKRLKN